MCEHPPGCTLIYAPKGQAGEYSPLAVNPYPGCGHGCSYCYVPRMLKMPRVEFGKKVLIAADSLKKSTAANHFGPVSGSEEEAA